VFQGFSQCKTLLPILVKNIVTHSFGNGKEKKCEAFQSIFFNFIVYIDLI